MNKKITLFLLIILTTFSGFSQKKGKIKGSRNVSNVITEIDTFEHIVVGESFKIKLTQGLTPSVEINADDNLHDVIEFAVQDGSLKFSTTKRIAAHKKLEIIVTAPETLNTIELKDDGEISDLSTIKADNMTLITKGSSKAFLTLRANLFKLVSGDKADSKLNVTADNATLELSENSDVEALINADKIEIDMYQNTFAKIEGDTDELELRLDNGSKFKGSKLTAKNCLLTIETKAYAEIEVSKKLTIEASGSTETNIYGSPKIELKTFQDKAILKKK